MRNAGMTTVADSTSIFQSGGGPRSVEEAADLVAHAAEQGKPLRIVGGGSWLSAGRPLHHTSDITPLSLANLSGIIEYVPGDLTLTALAGTTLEEIAEVTRPHGQWLPLDAPAARTATLGATLATASCGPMAATIGHPRDLTLGMEVIDGRGVRVRAGGRVVKNVAGFDLVRMQIGAWGTLGIITEATVRLRGLPELQQTLLLSGSGSVASLSGALRRLAHAPLAAELVNPVLAEHLGLPAETGILVRVAGNERAVSSSVVALTALGTVTRISDGVWRALADVEPTMATVLRLSGPPSNVGALWEAASRLGGRTTRLHASLQRGIVRVIAPLDQEVGPWLALAPCLVERTSAETWQAIPPVADDRLSRGLRAAMDPHGTLNPGLFGT